MLQCLPEPSLVCPLVAREYSLGRLPAGELAEHEDAADSLNVVLTRELNCGYSTTAGPRGLAEGRVPSGAGA